MLMRSLLRRLSLLCGLAVLPNVAVHAEGATCPEGYYPIGGSDAGWIGCAPIPGAHPIQPDPSPSTSSRSLPSYIAVAWHGNATDVWATWNQDSDEKAKKAALDACNKAMGSGCTIATVGWDASIAIARTQNEQLWYGWGETPTIAKKRVVAACEKRSPSCNVLHVFTPTRRTQPANLTLQPQVPDQVTDRSQNYFPDRSVGRKSSAARPAELNRGFFAAIAVGYTTSNEAQTAAIARCEVESKETCVSFGNIDNRRYPLFGLYHDSKDNVAWYNDSTAAGIEKSAVADCRDRKVTCQKIGIFDARKPGIMIQDIVK
jgi:hypothetical protein